MRTIPKMVFACVICGLSTVAYATNLASQMTEIAGAKGDKLASPITGDCHKPFEGPIVDQNTRTYTMNCLNEAAKHNLELLLASVQFILWDPEDNSVKGFALLEQAENAKGDNEDAKIFARGGVGFQARLEFLKKEIVEQGVRFGRSQ